MTKDTTTYRPTLLKPLPSQVRTNAAPQVFQGVRVWFEKQFGLTDDVNEACKKVFAVETAEEVSESALSFYALCHSQDMNDVHLANIVKKHVDPKFNGGFHWIAITILMVACPSWMTEPVFGPESLRDILKTCLHARRLALLEDAAQFPANVREWLADSVGQRILHAPVFFPILVLAAALGCTGWFEKLPFESLLKKDDEILAPFLLNYELCSAYVRELFYVPDFQREQQRLESILTMSLPKSPSRDPSVREAWNVVLNKILRTFPEPCLFRTCLPHVSDSLRIDLSGVLRKMKDSSRANNSAVQDLLDIVDLSVTMDGGWSRFRQNMQSDEYVWAMSRYLVHAPERTQSASSSAKAPSYANVVAGGSSSTRVTGTARPPADIVFRAIMYLNGELLEQRAVTRHFSEKLEAMRLVIQNYAEHEQIADLVIGFLTMPANQSLAVRLGSLRQVLPNLDAVARKYSSFPDEQSKQIARIVADLTASQPNFFKDMVTGLEAILTRVGCIQLAISQGLCMNARDDLDHVIKPDLLTRLLAGPNFESFFELLGRHTVTKYRNKLKLSLLKCVHRVHDMRWTELVEASKQSEAWVKVGEEVDKFLKKVADYQISVRTFDQSLRLERLDEFRIIGTLKLLTRDPDATFKSFEVQRRTIKAGFVELDDVFEMLRKVETKQRTPVMNEEIPLSENAVQLEKLKYGLAGLQFDELLDIARRFIKCSWPSIVFEDQLKLAYRNRSQEDKLFDVAKEALKLAKGLLGGSDTMDLAQLRTSSSKSFNREHEMKLIAEFCSKNGEEWRTLDSNMLGMGEMVLAWKDTAEPLVKMIKQLQEQQRLSNAESLLKDSEAVRNWACSINPAEKLVHEAESILNELVPFVHWRIISPEIVDILKLMASATSLERLLFDEMRTSDAEFSSMLAAMQNNSANSEEETSVLRPIDACRAAFSRLFRQSNPSENLNNWLQAAQQLARAQDPDFGLRAKLESAIANEDRLRMLVRQYEDDRVGMAEVDLIQLIGSEASVSLKSGQVVPLEEVLAKLQQQEKQTVRTAWMTVLLASTKRILPLFVGLVFQTACPTVSPTDPFTVFSSTKATEKGGNQDVVELLRLLGEASNLATEVGSPEESIVAGLCNLVHLDALYRAWSIAGEGLGRVALASSSQLRFLGHAGQAQRDTQRESLTQFCGLSKSLQLPISWNDPTVVFDSLRDQGRDAAVTAVPSTLRVEDLGYLDRRSSLFVEVLKRLQQNKLPSPGHLLFCSPVHLPHDVESFCRRVGELPNDVFVVICPSRLSHSARQALVSCVGNLRRKGKSGTLAVAFDNHEVHAALSRALGAERIHQTPHRKLSDIVQGRKLRLTTIEGSPGFGKSWHVRQEAAKLQAVLLHIPVHERFTANSACLRIIRAIESNPIKPIVIHLDLAGGESMLDPAQFFATVSEAERALKVITSLTRPLEELDLLLIRLSLLGFLQDDTTGETFALSEEVRPRVSIWVEFPGDRLLSGRFEEHLSLLLAMRSGTVNVENDRPRYVPSSPEEIFACRVLRVCHNRMDWVVDKLNMLLIDFEKSTTGAAHEDDHLVVESLLPGWSRRRQVQVLFTLAERFAALGRFARFQGLKPFHQRSTCAEAPRPPRGQDMNFNTIQVAFMIDATGSMDPYVKAVKDRVVQVMAEIEGRHPEAKSQFACVLYRDYDVEHIRIEQTAFTSADAVRHWLEGKVATGGDDFCEDVGGGLAAVTRLPWNAASRCVIWIADAPAHGVKYHDAKVRDVYLNGCPPGMENTYVDPAASVRFAAQNGIRLTFGRITDATDKMIHLLQKVYDEASANEDMTFQQVGLNDLSQLLDYVVTAMAMSYEHIATTNAQLEQLGPAIVEQTKTITEGKLDQVDKLVFVCGDESGSATLQVSLKGTAPSSSSVVTLASSTESERRNVLATAMNMASSSNRTEECLREMGFALEAQTTYRLLTQIEARASRSCVIWSGGTGIGKSEGSRVLSQLALQEGTIDFPFELERLVLDLLDKTDTLAPLKPIFQQKFVSIGDVSTWSNPTVRRSVSGCSDRFGPAIYLWPCSATGDEPFMIKVRASSQAIGTATLELINLNGSVCKIEANVEPKFAQLVNVSLGSNLVNGIVVKVHATEQVEFNLAVSVNGSAAPGSPFQIEYTPVSENEVTVEETKYVNSIRRSSSRIVSCLSRAIEQLQDGAQKDAARYKIGEFALILAVHWLRTHAIVSKRSGKHSLGQQLHGLMVKLAKEQTTYNFERALSFVDEIRLPNLMFKICLHPSTDLNDLRRLVGRAVSRLARLKAWAARSNESMSSSLICTVFLDELNTSPFPGIVKQLVLDRHIDGVSLAELGRAYTIGCADNDDISEDLFGTDAFAGLSPSELKSMKDILDVDVSGPSKDPLSAELFEQAAQAIFFVGAINPPLGVSSMTEPSTSSSQESTKALFAVGHLPQALEESTRPFGELDDALVGDMAESVLRAVDGLSGAECKDIRFLIREAHSIVTSFRLGNAELRIDASEDMDKCWCSIRQVIRTVRLFKFFLEHPALLFRAGSLKDIDLKQIATSATLDGVRLRRRASLVAICSTYWLQLTRVRTTSKKFIDLRERFDERLRNTPVLKRWVADTQSDTRVVPSIESDSLKTFMRIQMNAVTDRLRPLLSSQHALTVPLLEHLFAVFICTQACVPVLLVGPPGCSKTLAANIVLNGCRDVRELDERLFPGERIRPLSVCTFQCSDQSTAGEIEALFRRAFVQGENGRTLGTVFIDEASLAPRALKSAHEPLDTCRIAAVINSNYILDAAKTNRCLMVRRDPSQDDASDLESIAMSSVGLDKESVDEHLVIKGLVQGYQVLVGDASPVRTTFHLRHFIYLMRSLRRAGGYASEPKEIAQALATNFGGLPEADFERYVAKPMFEAIRLQFEEDDSDLKRTWEYANVDWQYDVLSLLEDALRGDPYALQAEETMDPNLHARRNVLLITSTEGFQWFRNLWEKDTFAKGRIVTDETVSMFPDENGSLGRQQIVGRIVRKMGGENLVFIHGGDRKVFGAFYDAFNMRFMPDQQHWRVNVGVGALWKSCRYDLNFRTCVVVDKDSYDAMRGIDSTMLPFLSRFEAFHVSPAELIASRTALKRLGLDVSDESSLQLLTSVVWRLSEFVSKACALTLAGVELLDPWEVAASVVLKTLREERPSSITTDVAKRMLQVGVRTLMQTARPEALCLRAGSEWIASEEVVAYVDDPLDHFSLARGLSQIVSASTSLPNSQSNKLVLVTRSSSLLSEPQRLGTNPETCVALEQCSTFSSLELQIQSILKWSDVVMIFANLAFVSPDQLEHLFRHVDLTLDSTDNKRVVVVLHRPAEEIAYDQIPSPKFVQGWSSVFVDDGRGVHPDSKPRDALLAVFTAVGGADTATTQDDAVDQARRILHLACDGLEIHASRTIIIDPEDDQLVHAAYREGGFAQLLQSPETMATFFTELLSKESQAGGIELARTAVKRTAEDKLRGRDTRPLETIARDASCLAHVNLVQKTLERIALFGSFPAILRLGSVDVVRDFALRLLELNTDRHDEQAAMAQVDGRMILTVPWGTVHTQTPFFLAFVEVLRDPESPTSAALLEWFRMIPVAERAPLDEALWTDCLRILCLVPIVPPNTTVSLKSCLALVRLWLEMRSERDILRAIQLVMGEKDSIKQNCQDAAWKLRFVAPLIEAGIVHLEDLNSNDDDFDSFFIRVVDVSLWKLQTSDVNDPLVLTAVCELLLAARHDLRVRESIQKNQTMDLIDVLAIGSALPETESKRTISRNRSSESVTDGNALNRIRQAMAVFNESDDVVARFNFIRTWVELGGGFLKPDAIDLVKCILEDEFKLKERFGSNAEAELLELLATGVSNTSQVELLEDSISKLYPTTTNAFDQLTSGHPSGLWLARVRVHLAESLRKNDESLCKTCQQRFNNRKNRSAARLGGLGQAATKTKTMITSNPSLYDALLLADMAVLLSRNGLDKFRSLTPDPDILPSIIAELVAQSEQRQRWFLMNIESPETRQALLERPDLAEKFHLKDLARDVPLLLLPLTQSIQQEVESDVEDTLKVFRESKKAQRLLAIHGLPLLHTHNALTKLAVARGWSPEMCLGDPHSEIDSNRITVFDQLIDCDPEIRRALTEAFTEHLGYVVTYSNRQQRNDSKEQAIRVEEFPQWKLGDVLGGVEENGSVGVLVSLFLEVSEEALRSANLVVSQQTLPAIAKTPLNRLGLVEIASRLIMKEEDDVSILNLEAHKARLDYFGLTSLVGNWWKETDLLSPDWQVLAGNSATTTMSSVGGEMSNEGVDGDHRWHEEEIQDDHRLEGLDDAARQLGERCAYGQEPAPDQQKRVQAGRFFNDSVTREADEFVSVLLQAWNRGQESFEGIPLRAASWGLLDVLLERHENLASLDVIFKSESIPNRQSVRNELLDLCKKQPRTSLKSIQRLFGFLLRPSVLETLSADPSGLVRAVLTPPLAADSKLVPTSIRASMLCDYLTMLQKIASRIKLRVMAGMNSSNQPAFDLEKELETLEFSEYNRVLHRPGAFGPLEHEEDEESLKDVDDHNNDDEDETESAAVGIFSRMMRRFTDLQSLRPSEHKERRRDSEMMSAHLDIDGDEFGLPTEMIKQRRRRCQIAAMTVLFILMLLFLLVLSSWS